MEHTENNLTLSEPEQGDRVMEELTTQELPTAELTTQEPAAEELPTEEPVTEEPPTEEATANCLMPQNLRVLGISNDATILWATDVRRLIRIDRLRDLDSASLIQVVGMKEMYRIKVVLKEMGAKANAAGIVRDLIADESRRREFDTSDFVGQGVFLLDGKPVIVSGNQAMRICDEASHQTEDINNPIIGSKIIEFDAARKWIDLAQLDARIRAMTQAAASEAWQCLNDDLGCWNFSHPSDKRTMAGLIGATPVQATLAFRPLVWLGGATNTGKTALLTLLRGLWTHAVALAGETSEAAIRQEIGQDSLPVTLDEFEVWHGRDRVVKLLRSATRGDRITKGSPSGKPIRFALQHIIWVASTDISLQRAVDRNRFITFELQPPSKIIIPDATTMADLGMTLLAAAIVFNARIRQGWLDLSQSETSRRHGRLGELHSLPVAVEAAFNGLTDEEAIALLEQSLQERAEELAAQAEPDHQVMLETIMSAPVRARIQNRYAGSDEQMMTIGDLIRGRLDEHALDLNGMKLIGSDKLFISPDVVRVRLLKGTRFSEMAIGDILKRIPGAECDRRRCAGVNQRGVSLPINALPIRETVVPVAANTDTIGTASEVNTDSVADTADTAGTVATAKAAPITCRTCPYLKRPTRAPVPRAQWYSHECICEMGLSVDEWNIDGGGDCLHHPARANDYDVNGDVPI